eukprot:977595-Amphidinium_carterae.1
MSAQGCGTACVNKDFPNASRFGCRLCSWLLVRGSLSCYVHNLYAVTSFDQDWGPCNEDLMLAVRERLETKRGCPQILLGDFQTHPTQQLVFRDLIREGWVSCVDVAAFESTNEASNGTTR